MALLPECDIFFARESWQANVEIGITKSRAAVSEGYQARKYPLPMGSREEKLKKAKSLDALPPISPSTARKCSLVSVLPSGPSRK